MKRFKRALCILLALFQIAGLLAYKTASAQSKIAGRGARPGVQVGDMNKGLQVKLSEGAPVSERPELIARASAVQLSESDVQSVLKRLEPIKADASDEQDFALRERSLAAPRIGKTVNASFPPAAERDTIDKPATGALEVVRYSPEGDVPLAPQLSVTFSQPMVAVTSHADSLSGDLPVKLTPQPEGHWRWVGTKTLLFETETRFPMATEYAVEVPAGTKSATGATFAAGKRWKFATPPPQVKSFYPKDGPHRRDPLMFVEFDQRVSPEAVLKTIHVRSGRAEYKMRLADKAEIEADETVKNLAAAATKDRWLAFRVIGSNSQMPLPADAGISVSIGPGTPSMEGPRTTTSPQQFSFRTYGPLRMTKYRCGWQSNCSPFDQWNIEFSNPLDAESFQSSQLKVEPEIAGIKTAVYGNTLTINGAKRGRTTYRVTLDSSIRDQFGQTLGTNALAVFNVGSAQPALASSGDQFIVLDPAAHPRFSVFSINHPALKVRLYKVGPEHWSQFAIYMRGHDDNTRATPPGRIAYTDTIAVNAQPDEMAETRIDLSKALDGGFGHVIIVVEPSIAPKNRYDRQQVVAWVQATQIGLDAFVDNSELIAWATSLKDGKPVSGVQMTIQPTRISAVTEENGLAHLALKSEVAKGPNLLVARKGRDTAILPENNYYWDENGGWVKKEAADLLRWFVFDDRKMYRPGEEVHVKGWVRRVGAAKDGDINLPHGAARNITYWLKDSRGNEVLKGNVDIDMLGGFDTAFKLPPTMNLGYANLEFEAQSANVTLGNLGYAHQFQVQEFRRPEFEVTAAASEGPHFVGNSASVTSTAAYYAGGGLANSEMIWRVTSSPAQFTPPNRDDFTFGKWIPWWIARNDYLEKKVETFTARTDAAGRHTLRVDFVSVDPLRPSTVTAEASVTDVNRQAWTASTSMLVHPAALYVGVRSPRTFVQKGEPLIVQSIACDLDGKLISGRTIKMRAVLLDWVYEKGEWQQKESNPQMCEVKSANDPVECRFETKEGGVYRVTATIEDDRERRNESELTLWVAGGKVVPRRNVEQEDASLIPDRKDYQPNDVAEILIQAPFFPAEGVMTLRRSGIVTTEQFKMDGPSYTLKVPIKESYTPNIYVQVDLVGASARTDEAGKPNERLPRRPAFAKGSLNLPVPPLARKLAIEAKPRARALEPGGETVVDVEVRDAKGEPVAGSQLAVVVVDEAILGLTGYRIGDPMLTFYALRGDDTNDYHLRQEVLLANPEDLIAQIKNQPLNGRGAAELAEAAQGLAGGVGGGNAAMRMAMPAPPPIPKARARKGLKDGASDDEAEQIRLRQNFNALATFASAVPTDSNGRASIEVKLPDSLTRYRIMAVAVAGGKQFGGGESTITARLPLMIRPSAPRFLNFGDKFELPVVVQNQTDAPMSVNVAVRAANAELTEGAGRLVTVPANDRVEVRFPTSAARAGTARFQIAAVAGNWVDAAEISLPVWTPATTEAFATYGEIDAGAIVQPVKAPTDSIKQFGGVEITTSSTELQALTDAVLYLVAYPFECAEQLSSRVLAVAALKDVLAAFKAKGLPEPKEMVEAVARDIKRLQARQNDNGSFGFWRRGDDSWPYVSVHVTHALQRAKEKGFDVPSDMLERAKKYLREIEPHIPYYYSAQARRAVIAYALYVRNRMGDKDAVKARMLITEAGLDGLSLESMGWLLSVLTGDANSTAQVAMIRKHINNHATEEAATAHFVTSYSDGDHLLLHSSRRTDGVILEALIADQPDNDLIPKLVRGLLAHRKEGRWENTQENTFVLLALDKYFGVYEKTTPDFVARAWLGEGYAGDHKFSGRTTERFNVNIPMRYLADTNAPKDLILSKEGAGRMYYRVGMQYAPASLKLAPSEHGFTVERIYEAIDKADDVRRDADGTWHIKAGAQVRVRLTMIAPSRRYHVALVDAIPAGLEAMNPELAVTGSIPQDPKDNANDKWWWWRRPWFEHQNMRDERVEAFASLVWEGVYTYSYVARATTPGVFVVPPPKAEEMYHPETFGRGGTDRVIVE
jgi:uncharacterized protein YfaS (alpha-2-macroglobulin family)